jgi:hypothetical protein
MGGLGSGRWGWPRKVRVEECTVLDLDAWVSAGLFDYRSGRIEWVSPSMETAPPLAYLIRPTDVGTCLYLYLRSLDGGEESKWKPVTLLSAPQHFGGVRWHFSCPRACGRWVRKLYRPPSIGFLGCRICHELSYRSVQEHGCRLAFFRRNPAHLDAALEAGSLLAAGYVAQKAFRWQPKRYIVDITELPIDPAIERLKDWEIREYVPRRTA